VKVLPRNTIITGDARLILPDLLPESCDTAITSPPYPGLRDYGRAGQLGQEATVAEYVENLRAVLRQVRRLLKPTGSLWLNLGDAHSRHPRQGVPAKGLLLAPQRVALALAEDGWLIRSIVIWKKSNPMPQSARDRLSPTYETIIFATKRPRYYFSLDEIRVPHRSVSRIGQASPASLGRLYQGHNDGLGKLRAAGQVGNPKGKNPGDVWVTATAVDRLGHQATFPEQLIERPILAACPERVCVQCDRAWTRPTRIVRRHTSEGVIQVRKVGELRRCDCFAPSRPGVVLDCFAGTGTTLVVAKKLNRDFLGIELNPTFSRLARRRLRRSGCGP
jgi:site-specific DNA-methyltransferase (adenine-specific)